jgi:hypothetical protein
LGRYLGGDRLSESPFGKLAGHLVFPEGQFTVFLLTCFVSREQAMSQVCTVFRRCKEKKDDCAPERGGHNGLPALKYYDINNPFCK